MYTIIETKTVPSYETIMYRVKIAVDTAEETPTPLDEWAVGSEMEVYENGGSRYKLGTDREWYPVNFKKGSGGGDNSEVADQVNQNTSSISLLTGRVSRIETNIGGHTVKSDVPENAVFTDTVYDDSEVKEDIEQNKTDILSVEEDLSVLNQNRLSTDINLPSLWEQGHLTDSGENGASNAQAYPVRIRTKRFIPKNIKHISVSAGFEFIVYKYSADGTFVNYEKVTGSSYTTDTDSYDYRIVLAKEDRSAISISDYRNLQFCLHEGTNDVLDEIVQAKTDAKGETYSTLSTRLDSADINTDIAINATFDIGSPITPTTKAEGYKLTGEGTCVRDTTGVRIVKYAVTEGEILYLNLAKDHDCVYQWQNDVSIPTSNPTNLISVVNEAVNGFVIVPTGATYLMVSQNQSNTSNVVANAVSKFDSQDAINQHLEETKVSVKAISYGYTTDLNNAAMWEQGHLADNGSNGGANSNYYLRRIRTKSFIPIIDKIVSDTTHFFFVYIYNLDGTISEITARISEFSNFDFENYNYRVVAGKYPDSPENPVNAETGYSGIYFFKNDITGTKSVFDKHETTDFGCVPYTYYRGLGDDYSNFNSETMYSEVISAFDTLVQEYPNFLTKTELGLSSDNRTIYEYTYMPKRDVFYTGLQKKYPKILIISAQHGFEKSSVYGLYYFLKDLLSKYEENELLEYIHDNVCLKIIPVVNPYGFDNNLYVNANEVNINRNYLCNAWTDTGTGSQYGGTEPFSEPESCIVRDFVLNNLDAYLFIDYHTNGRYAVTENKKINWHSYRTSSDSYYNKLQFASARHITRQTSMFAKDYNIDFGNELAGYIDSGNSTASSEKYAYDNGIIGLCFEGFNGFVGEASFSEREKKANSELIGNFIGEALRCYSNDLY